MSIGPIWYSNNHEQVATLSKVRLIPSAFAEKLLERPSCIPVDFDQIETLSMRKANQSLAADCVQHTLVLILNCHSKGTLHHTAFGHFSNIEVDNFLQFSQDTDTIQNTVIRNFLFEHCVPYDVELCAFGMIDRAQFDQLKQRIDFDYRTIAMCDTYINPWNIPPSPNAADEEEMVEQLELYSEQREITFGLHVGVSALGEIYVSDASSSDNKGENGFYQFDVADFEQWKQDRMDD